MYENLSNITTVDSMLDSVASLLWVQPRDRQPLMRSLVTHLGKSNYLAGNNNDGGNGKIVNVPMFQEKM